ncbi:MAG: selenocysteine-specific translation elongation factor [Deltaproteobacteria bacterium]|nr:selenocysteine-specific translation elongation factor [Deltaproteobacteria bacterium]
MEDRLGARIVIGTAGHIDHGKSSLVEALTGTDPDRLAQEKARGITLELGFAHLDLGEGLEAGVVDVPGHERFVRTMVAGAGGIDLVVLVVAMDEGVMPQTREHLDVCSLLGIERGVIALTKADLAGNLDPDWEALVRADVEEAVAGTFLEGAPVVRVSARSGEGLEALVDTLRSLAREVGGRRDDGPLFLPIDRVFTLAGFGTVITGTLRTGRVRVGDTVEVLPRQKQPRQVRVRGIQVHGAAAEEARAGQRTALNLAGIETAALSRGEVVAEPDAPATGHLLDARVRLLATAGGPLKQRARLHFHIGTAQASAEVVLLERPGLEPGTSQLAQVQLDRPVAVLPGQPFILRGSRILEGRGRTVGGGQVLAVAGFRRRPSRPEHARWLARLADPRLEQRTEALIHAAGPAGIAEALLPYQAGEGRREITKVVERLLSTGAVIVAEPDPRKLAHREALEELAARVHERLEAHQQQDQTGLGLPLAELQSSLPGPPPPRLFRRLIDLLREDEAYRVEGGDRIALAGGGARQEDLEARQAAILASLEEAGLAPPRLGELAARLDLPEDQLAAVLSRLTAEGKLVRVRRDLHFATRAIEALEEELVAHLDEHGEITTAEFKAMTGTTRKHAIPLAEHFDNAKVTLRKGEVRVRRGRRPGGDP